MITKDSCPEEIQEAFLKCADELTVAASAATTALNSYVILRDFKDEKFSEILMNIRKHLKAVQSKVTHAECERLVYVSDEWTAYKRTMIDAETNYNDARCAQKVAEINWETVRSIMSDKRTERFTRT